MQVAIAASQPYRRMLVIGPDMAKVLAVVTPRKATLSSVNSIFKD
jgi:hypothetical protein